MPRIKPVVCPDCGGHLYDVAEEAPEIFTVIGDSGPFIPEASRGTCPHCWVALELVSIPARHGIPSQLRWKVRQADACEAEQIKAEIAAVEYRDPSFIDRLLEGLDRAARQPDVEEFHRLGDELFAEYEIHEVNRGKAAEMLPSPVRELYKAVREVFASALRGRH